MVKRVVQAAEKQSKGATASAGCGLALAQDPRFATRVEEMVREVKFLPELGGGP